MVALPTSVTVPVLEEMPDQFLWTTTGDRTQMRRCRPGNGGNACSATRARSFKRLSSFPSSCSSFSSSFSNLASFMDPSEFLKPSSLEIPGPSEIRTWLPSSDQQPPTPAANQDVIAPWLYDDQPVSPLLFVCSVSLGFWGGSALSLRPLAVSLHSWLFTY